MERQEKMNASKAREQALTNPESYFVLFKERLYQKIDRLSKLGHCSLILTIDEFHHPRPITVPPTTLNGSFISDELRNHLLEELRKDGQFKARFGQTCLFGLCVEDHNTLFVSW